MEAESLFAVLHVTVSLKSSLRGIYTCVGHAKMAICPKDRGRSCVDAKHGGQINPRNQQIQSLRRERTTAAGQEAGDTVGSVVKREWQVKFRLQEANLNESSQRLLMERNSPLGEDEHPDSLIAHKLRFALATTMKGINSGTLPA